MHKSQVDEVQLKLKRILSDACKGPKRPLEGMHAVLDVHLKQCAFESVLSGPGSKLGVNAKNRIRQQPLSAEHRRAHGRVPITF